MSASKKDELLKSLTRRDAQKPPMEVTYENKKDLLGQITERSTEGRVNGDYNGNIDSNSDGVNIDSDKHEINVESENNIYDERKYDTDINNGVDSNNGIVIEQDSSLDAIDALLSVSRKPAPAKIFKGFYLEPDIAKVLEKLSRKHGKGIQSQIVNEALRMVFRDKGLI